MSLGLVSQSGHSKGQQNVDACIIFGSLSNFVSYKILTNSVRHIVIHSGKFKHT